MLKKALTLLILLTLGVSGLSHAQKCDIKLGAKNPKHKKAVYTSIVDAHQGNIWALSVRGGFFKKRPDLNLVHFNGSGYVIDKEAEVKLPDYRGTGLGLDHFWIDTEGNRMMISTFASDDADCQAVLVHQLDKNGMVKSSKKMDELLLVKSTDKSLAEPRMYHSEDSSKVAFVVDSWGDKKSAGSEEFQVYVFNRDLQPLFKYKTKLPMRESQTVMGRSVLDNNGNFYVTLIEYLTKDQLKSRKKAIKQQSKKDRTVEAGQVRTNVYVFGYYNKGEEVRKFDVTMDKFISVGFTMKVNSLSGNLNIAGLYADNISKRGGGVDGMYLLEYDAKTQKLVYDRRVNFKGKVDANDGFTSKKNRRKNNAGANVGALGLREIVTRSDGSTLLLAEQSWVERRCSRDNKGNETCRYYTHNEDVYVGHFAAYSGYDTTGNVKLAKDWMIKIEKHQVEPGTSTVFGGYTLIPSPKHVWLIFNDYKKNYPVDGSEPKKLRAVNLPGKKAVVVVGFALDDDNGKIVSKKPLFAGKEAGVYFLPGVSKQMSANDFIVTCMTRKSLHIATVHAE